MVCDKNLGHSFQELQGLEAKSGFLESDSKNNARFQLTWDGPEGEGLNLQLAAVGIHS